jgi:dolichol-phosphate mannosyltransferase
VKNKYLKHARISEPEFRSILELVCADCNTTNAFKAYRKTVIDGIRPILSPHFNITVELPLKAIVRGFSFTVIPITWRNRRTGEAKLKIKEMGSRYLFICLYVWLEKYFSRGDYRVQE